MKKWTILVLATLALAAHAGGDLTLWYNSPAAKGMNEGLPIGNGTMGGMILGGVDREVVQFNEISLWTGAEISTDDYGKMGAYQKFGDVVVELPTAPSKVSSPVIICPSEQKAFYDSETIAASGDDDPATKWCVEHNGKPVIWEMRLPEARVVNRYAIVSGNDTPQRDPSTWEFSASNDGREWIVLDRHEKEEPFSRRGEKKLFIAANEKAAKPYRLFRLTFQPGSAKHFQVAEISIPGVTAAAGAQASAPEGYRRSLDLATATHLITYKAGDVTFRREAFASHPDGVMVMRFSADRPGQCRGVVKLAGAHKETSKAAEGAVVFSGALDNGLRYEARVLVMNEGGKLATADGNVAFEGCDAVTLLLAAETDYVADHAKKYRSGDPAEKAARKITAASKKSYADLKAAHMADYQAIFNRVALDFGASAADRVALPTDQRKVVYAEKGEDPDMEELMTQYGRYLLIACSRPGGLPANLQGLWNDSNNPPWHSDYHANINIQMNYWLAEPANLSELHTPLFDLLGSQLEPWRVATAQEKRFATASGKSRGWAVRTSHGINGDQGWQWDVSANAWYCQHYWMHYECCGDKAWLAKIAYPVMKETCEFWEDRLKKLPDGRLVVPNAWSPEHGPHEDGVSYSQQIVWDLFNNYVAASEALGVDADYRAKVAAMRDALVGPQIGKWGQLQEWMTDRDDPNDHHRHTSHLFAVFPGKQIGISKSPEFAAAAKKSLVARGEDAKSDVREWSFAWRCALYARLHDGENARRMLQMLLANRNTCRNLFGLHPPMQIDGNFGITAGVCEMLLQSHEGEIALLPALPAAWPTGEVKGLKARGGFTVDVAWKDGKVTKYRIASETPSEVSVRVGGEVKKIRSEKI